VRAYAVNEIGIAYGEQKTFTTTDAFYDGFETGFSGNTGSWGIASTSTSVEGAFCLATTQGGSVASLTRTLTNGGHISFFFKNNPDIYKNLSSIYFFIDDTNQATLSSGNWMQVSYPIEAGTHTFKWQYNATSYSGNVGYIDFIVMPK